MATGLQAKGLLIYYLAVIMGKLAGKGGVQLSCTPQNLYKVKLFYGIWAIKTMFINNTYLS